MYKLLLILLLTLWTVSHYECWGQDTVAVTEQENQKTGVGKKLKNLRLGKGIKETRTGITIKVELEQAKIAENKGRYMKAVQHYRKIVGLHAELGDHDKVAQYNQQIAELLTLAGRNQEALDQYERVLDHKEALKDTTDLAQIRQQLRTLSPDSSPLIITDSTELKEVSDESARLKTLAEVSERNQNYQQSLEYYKLYNQLNAQIKEQENAQLLALQEKTFQLEKQAQEISLMESEQKLQAATLDQQQAQLEKDRAFKRNLLIGLGLLLVGAGAILFLYSGKQRALKSLNHAYADLSTTKDQLQLAENRLKGLLNQQVSKGIAQELLNQSDRVQKKFVCVMFLDIRGFTPFAEKLNPEELIAYQNKVFGFMIEIIDAHRGVINQFLGDGFMATFGLQDEESADCDNAFAAAREIVEMVETKNQSGEIPHTRVGIGLHAGKVVAGNVGTDVRKQYSITGNTVITAARIEQLNKTLDSQLLISKEVYRELTDQQSLPQEFTKVQVKGRVEEVELLKIA